MNKTNFDIIYKDTVSIVDQWHTEHKSNQWLLKLLLNLCYMSTDPITPYVVYKAITNSGFSSIAEEWKRVWMVEEWKRMVQI